MIQVPNKRQNAQFNFIACGNQLLTALAIKGEHQLSLFFFFKVANRERKVEQHPSLNHRLLKKKEQWRKRRLI